MPLVAAAIRTACKRARAIPFAFLGMAFYRTWVSVFFIESAIPSGVGMLPGGMGRIDYLDAGCAVVVLLCAVFFRRIGTLHGRSRCWFPVALCMSALSGVMTVRYMWGIAPDVTDAVVSVVCGVGFGLMILLWAEAYACLSPLNVALYYSVSLIFEQFLIFMVTHYPSDFALWVAAPFPLVSLACYMQAVRKIPSSDLPCPTSLKTTLPWKIILLVCLSSFVQGMVSTYSFSHGLPTYMGILVPAVVVLVSVLMGTRRFNFHTVCLRFLPIMAACVVLSIPLQALNHGSLAEFFAIAANRTVVLLMFVVLCGMAGTYRMSAILLFGVERTCMLGASMVGRAVGTAGGVSGASLEQVVLFTVFAGILMAVFLYLFFSERYLSSLWGVVFKGDAGAEHEELAAVRALNLARAHGLSERETEVLLAAIRGRSVKEIEEELFIANGTVKAHLQHIYRKLDVHSKRELCALVGSRIDSAERH